MFPIQAFRLKLMYVVIIHNSGQTQNTVNITTHSMTNCLAMFLAKDRIIDSLVV